MICQLQTAKVLLRVVCFPDTQVLPIGSCDVYLPTMFRPITRESGSTMLPYIDYMCLFATTLTLHPRCLESGWIMLIKRAVGDLDVPFLLVHPLTWIKLSDRKRFTSNCPPPLLCKHWAALVTTKNRRKMWETITIQNASLYSAIVHLQNALMSTVN